MFYLKKAFGKFLLFNKIKIIALFGAENAKISQENYYYYLIDKQICFSF